VWTDGSFSHERHVGGWGLVMKEANSRWHLELNGQVLCNDSNYAELYAMLAALCLIDRPSIIKFKSDSHVARIAVRGREIKSKRLAGLAELLTKLAQPHKISSDVAKTSEYLQRCHILSRMAVREEFVDLKFHQFHEYRLASVHRSGPLRVAR